jgi:hypothetical protein
MTANSLLLALLAISFLAGCLAPHAPATAPVDPPLPGSPAASPTTPPTTQVGEPSARTAQQVPLTFNLTEVESPSSGCAPPSCLGYRFAAKLYFDGSWSGFAAGSGLAYWNVTTNRVEYVYDSIVFKGTVGACGTGSITLTAYDEQETVPTQDGVHLVGWFAPVAGTATGDLVGIGTAKIPLEGYWKGTSGMGDGAPGVRFLDVATSVSCVPHA